MRLNEETMLGWYPFGRDSRKIVVESPNMVDPFTDRTKYDYIIVRDSWETLNEPVSFFADIRKHLNDTGKILIMANNRLGIRYFCGDKDKYTGTVGDCLEAYHDIPAQAVEGRMYSQAEMREILESSGYDCLRFFSVMTDMDNPAMVISENYSPNEDLTNRLIPTYNSPDTIYADERYLYKHLMDNGMFHQMANAYLIEYAADGDLSDILHVTSSLERGPEDALYTVIYGSGVVEKKAAYPEGRQRLRDIADNAKRLQEHGICTIRGTIEDDTYRMEYVKNQISQVYFSQLIREDRDAFIREMDHFRDTILRSSDVVSNGSDKNGGVILHFGYPDMVPLNSFHIGDDFVFFDQEFCEENYPANEIIWRMIATFYAGDPEAEKIYPRDELLKRYKIYDDYRRWQDMEWDFLKNLRKERELRAYHDRVRAKRSCIRQNKSAMNESAADRERRYCDIFRDIEGKRLYLFGSGEYADRFLDMYGDDFPVCGMLDNDESRQGTKKKGIMICSPDALRDMKPGTFKVMICMKSYGEAARQLQDMGVTDYSVYNPNRYYETRPRTSIRIVEAAPGEVRGTKAASNTGASEKAGNAADSSSVNGDKHYHIGYCAGAFDMFHIGHLNLLRRAKERCDYLIVGVMSDERMYNLKGKYPVIPCNERMQVVAGCRYVDQVEELPADRAGIMDAWNMFHFDCMFSGDDHADNPGWLAERERLRERGSDIVFVSYTKEQSSSAIREKMKE